MFTPPAFCEDDPNEFHRLIRDARLSTVVTATSIGIMATPLPLIDETEGDHGALYGHLVNLFLCSDSDCPTCEQGEL